MISYGRVLRTMSPSKRNGWVDAGLCPFHEDRHRGNFRIHLATEAYCCFACGAKGGDILGFHQAYTGQSFADSLLDLTERFYLSAGERP